MKLVQQTQTFFRWYSTLKGQTLVAVDARLFRMQYGNLGDVKSVGNGVREARIHTGGGIRIYFAERDHAVILLLAGGDKSTQKRDIEKAKMILQET